MKRVYIVMPCMQTIALFQKYGWGLAKEIDDADLVCFTGGEDVNPKLYNHPVHPLTFFSEERDEKEIDVFMKCIDKKVPMVGICRGGQLLNVLSGGEMYQHVTRHGRSHDMVNIITGETMGVTSTHHQMMKPSSDALIIGIAHQGGTREWYDNEVKKFDVSDTDIEVVYYKNTNSLCFQPHPEYSNSSRFAAHFFELIEEYTQ